MFVGSGTMGTFVLLLCVLLSVCGGSLDSDRELCYSRQHRDVTVNVHAALEQKGTVMVPRAKPSEKDCILTCCSEDVSPGVKCNLVVYKPPERPGALNCQLFHCPNERDCPLMTASAGINTYNIYKGVSHPTTKGTGRVTAKPAAPQLTTTTPMTTPTTTPTSTPTTTPTTTTTTPATTTTTTTTTTTPTSTTSSTSTSTEPPEEAPTESESLVMLETVAMTTAAATTATSTTATSTTQSTTTTKSTSTKAAHPPPRAPAKPNRPRKPSKPSRPETHSVKPIRATTIPTTHPTSSTPTTTTTTTTTTTLTPSTAPPPTAERSTAEVIELESDPKRRDFNRPVLSLPGKPKVSRVMWKNSLVAIVVITLIFLALILSLVARKAMESFDRRHYTRLELNDLHYEV